MSTHVTVARAQDGVVAVRLCDAAGRNALSEALVNALLAALEAVTADAEARVVVLEGLEDVFCSGASKAVLERLARREIAPTDILLSKALLDVPVPTIAAMEGHAVGGGFALGLCADLVLLARESRYGCPFMDMGFTPGMGTTRLLESVLSRAVAHELLFTGELRRGADFEGRSGFNYVLPRREVRPRAYELAARIADKPRPALEMLKRTLSLDKRRAFEETRTLEGLMHAVSFAQADIGRRIEDGYAE